MKYAYALLEPGTSEWNSDRLAFARFRDVDEIIADYPDQPAENRRNMLERLEAGDQVYFQAFDSCASGTEDFKLFMTELLKKDVRIQFWNEKVDTYFLKDKEQLLELCRTRGAQMAKIRTERTLLNSDESTKGKRGRKEKTVDPALFEETYRRLQEHEITKKEMCEILAVSYPTLMKLLAARERS